MKLQNNGLSVIMEICSMSFDNEEVEPFWKGIAEKVPV